MSSFFPGLNLQGSRYRSSEEQGAIEENRRFQRGLPLFPFSSLNSSNIEQRGDRNWTLCNAREADGEESLAKRSAIEEESESVASSSELEGARDIQEERRDWTQLPVELWSREILPLVRAEDAVSLAHTCRDMHGVLRGDLFLSRLLTEKGDGQRATLSDGVVRVSCPSVLEQVPSSQRNCGHLMEIWRAQRKILREEEAAMNGRIRRGELIREGLSTRIEPLFVEAAGSGVKLIVEDIIRKFGLNHLSQESFMRAFEGAVQGGHAAIVTLLIEGRAFKTMRTFFLEEMMKIASENHRVTIMQALLASEQGQNIRPLCISSCFLSALRRNAVDVVKGLLADRLWQKRIMQSVDGDFSFAVRYHYRESCQALREVVLSPCFVKVSTKSLEEVLHKAATEGDTKMIQMLIEHARFSEISKETIKTAIQNSPQKTARLLIECGRFSVVEKPILYADRAIESTCVLM